MAGSLSQTRGGRRVPISGRPRRSSPIRPARIARVLVAVRLSLRGPELCRRWISFSIIDEPFLRGLQVPNAELERDIVDNTVRFSFSENERPLATPTSLTVVPSEELSPPRCYPRRDALSRQITLVRDE